MFCSMLKVNNTLTDVTLCNVGATKACAPVLAEALQGKRALNKLHIGGSNSWLAFP